MSTAETQAPPITRKPIKVEYPNLRSRIFLNGFFQRQFIIPEDPPWMLEKFMLFYEKFLMRIDLSNIKVEKPIFLLGLPRSGTTMLQDIICTHPQIAFFTNAMHQFPWNICAVETLRKMLKLDGKGERYLGDSVEVQAGSPNEGLKFWGYWFGWDPHNVRYTPRAPESFTQEEIDAIHYQLKRVIWCHGPDRRFFTKNPALIPDIAILKHIFPEAKFIHIVRDPRHSANSLLKLYRLEAAQLDLIRSETKHGLYDRGVFIPYPRIPKLGDYLDLWGPSDLRTTANVWNDAVTIIRDWGTKLDHFLEVKYEDILADPKKQLMRLFEFAELRPVSEDDRMFWDKLSNVGNIHHKNSYGNFELVEQICKDNMDALGYKREYS